MNRRCRLLSAVLLYSFALCPLATPFAADEKTPAAAPSVASLVTDLNSDEYAVRRQATRALARIGVDAVEPLAAAAQEGPLEVSIRAFRILQELYAGSDDDETIDAAEAALERLAESTNRTLAARAEGVLESFYEMREQRALVQIERLGGVINYREENERRFNGNNVDPDQKQIAYVLLGKKWKGGDEGLKYIRRMSRLHVLYLSGTGDKAPISDEAKQKLEAAMPNLMIQPRGAAYLGIGGAPHPRGCQILQVKEGTSAAKGGLREFDVITAFGVKKIDSFDTLIEHIKQYEPGDKVQVEVLRGAETVTLEVVMGEWK